MRAWRRSKLGRPCVVEGHDLAVEHRPAGAQRPRQRAQLRIARREVGEVAALEREVAEVAEGDRADAVPLDLEAPALLVARQLAGAGQHRGDAGPASARRRVRRRVHAVDHPVLARACGTARSGPARARRGRSRSPRRRGTSRPRRCRGPRSPSSRRRTRPSGSRPRTPGTRAGGPRCGRRGGSRFGCSGIAARQRPRGEHAVVLQAQVPVQARGVVLLDHEAAVPGGAVAAAARLGGLLEVALRAVALELLRHRQVESEVGRAARRWTPSYIRP